jgi:hypothetical protein
VRGRHTPRDRSSKPESRPWADRIRTATPRGHVERCAGRQSSDRAADARDSERLPLQCGGQNVTGAKGSLRRCAPLTRPARSRVGSIYRSDEVMTTPQLRLTPWRSPARPARRAMNSEKPICGPGQVQQLVRPALCATYPAGAKFTARHTACHRSPVCRRTNKSVPDSRDRLPACSYSISQLNVTIATPPASWAVRSDCR